MTETKNLRQELLGTEQTEILTQTIETLTNTKVTKRHRNTRTRVSGVPLVIGDDEEKTGK